MWSPLLNHVFLGYVSCYKKGITLRLPWGQQHCSTTRHATSITSSSCGAHRPCRAEGQQEAVAETGQGQGCWIVSEELYWFRFWVQIYWFWMILNEQEVPAISATSHGTRYRMHRSFHPVRYQVCSDGGPCCSILETENGKALQRGLAVWVTNRDCWWIDWTLIIFIPILI